MYQDPEVMRRSLINPYWEYPQNVICVFTHSTHVHFHFILRSLYPVWLGFRA